MNNQKKNPTTQKTRSIYSLVGWVVLPLHYHAKATPARASPDTPNTANNERVSQSEIEREREREIVNKKEREREIVVESPPPPAPK